MSKEEIKEVIREGMNEVPQDFGIVGIEQNALVCNVGGGRIRLIALTDLVDPSMMVDMQEEEIAERIKFLEDEYKKTDMLAQRP